MARDLGIGELITGYQRRDAIHVAVAPVTVAETVKPGQHVAVNEAGQAVSPKHPTHAVGVIDPYLLHPVEVGQRCWVFLYPETIHDMVHHWYHPAFPTVDKATEQSAAELWLRDFSEAWGLDFDQMIHNASNGDALVARGRDIHSWSELDDKGAQFWDQLGVFIGRPIDTKTRSRSTFTCSC